VSILAAGIGFSMIFNIGFLVIIIIRLLITLVVRLTSSFISINTLLNSRDLFSRIIRLRNSSGQPGTVRSGFRSGPIQVEVFQGPDRGGPG
jgi:hypothetical protein